MPRGNCLLTHRWANVVECNIVTRVGSVCAQVAKVFHTFLMIFGNVAPTFVHRRQNNNQCSTYIAGRDVRCGGLVVVHQIRFVAAG